ncbi:hypothetical protein [Streptomyces iconiensis]|uniref:Lipoprotein n=1 Tax=Streptomyces iconiensis TaxID=1384038 RepID=A0ABT7A8J4_9ACTN|nr:hypothetical protein [Streptomyces iconiensis]MDJ1137620.1 hypothetical protein [Streptomyces iconiensis]
MRDRCRKRNVGRIAGAVLAVSVLGVAGCSNDADSGEKEPAAKGSTAPQDSDDGKGSNDSKDSGGGKETGSSEPPQAAGTPHSTAQEAVASWVGAIVKGQPKKACLVMAGPTSGSSPAQVGNPKRCNSNEPDVVKMRDGAGRFREAFSPKPPPSNPKVEVAKTPVADGKTVVPADKVTIDGQSLEKVILSNSTGVKEGQLDVKVHAAEIKNAWYVTDFDLSVG